MKTITFTASEISVLEEYLFCNPCESSCMMNYKKIDCYDLDENGEYKCKFKKETENILRKIGHYGK